MTTPGDLRELPEHIRERYESYLATSFFFRDPGLRASFREALQGGESLLRGLYPESPKSFERDANARELAASCFPDEALDLAPALIDRPLYSHQADAIRASHLGGHNIVVATGTASGKTESFLYPILFELYRQHLKGTLSLPGVRALILYPMNALANDQRQRLGKISESLMEAGSTFRPTFGQYIGETPENARDQRRGAAQRAEDRLPGELVFREEMRGSPPPHPAQQLLNARVSADPAQRQPPLRPRARRSLAVSRAG